MADSLRKERLQPSLLDRLTDLRPDETQESRDARTLSPSRLRECVRRDLAWLLNTTKIDALEPMGRFAEIARSVLNYGFIDLAGKTKSSINVGAMEDALRDTVIIFEPRLVPSTVKVKAILVERAVDQNAVAFVIDAELWAQPLPLRLFLKTAIDLESGTVDVAVQEAQGNI